MLSQPYSTSLTPNHHHQTRNHGSSGEFSLQRTSSVSSLLFARRSSTSSSYASSSTNQLSPFHQRIWYQQNPSSTELDHCWGGNGGGRRSREEHRDACQDLYDFLKLADLEEYYTAFSKHMKV